MRRILGLLSLGITACVAAPPAPAIIVATAPEPAVKVVAKDPVPKKAVDSKRILGAWGWNDDIEVFYPDGKGIYYRGGDVCYEFVYEIEGDVLTKTADRDHYCSLGREHSFRFRIDHGELVMKHLGSGFESRWTPTRGP